MSWVAPKVWAPPPKPASEPMVTIVLRANKREGAPPAFALFFPGAVLAKLGWVHGSRFRLHVGEDRHAGWLRIELAGAKDEAAVPLARRIHDSGALDFGRLTDVFGDRTGRARVPFVHVGDAIEIAVPKPEAFAPPKAKAGRPRKDRDDVVGAGKVEGALASRSEAKAPPPPASPAPPPQGGRTGSAGKAAAPAKPDDGPASGAVFTLRGVTVDQTYDAETIAYAGSEMEVTASQAALVRWLLPAAPSPVGEAWLISKVWHGDKDGPAKLKVCLRNLGPALEAVGLGLKHTKGVGVQLTGVK